MTRYTEVYGTLPEAREYIAEEFNLPLPLPVSVIPPQNIRSGPIRTLTYYPEESLSGVGGAAAPLLIGGVIAFALASLFLGRNSRAMRNPEEFATMCAWCKRLRVEGEWLKMEPHPEAMVTHGICDACEAVLNEEIEAVEKAELLR